MHFLGLVLFIAGCVGTGLTVSASFSRSRRAAALYGLAAPVCVLVGLVGGLLLFVPDFFG